MKVKDIIKKAKETGYLDSDLSEIKTDIEDDYRDWFSRISDRVNSGLVLNDLSTWICENTYLGGKKFSFNEHEFQIDIARETANDGVIQKCSQVGLTELAIRIMLALMALSMDKHGIYVLPSAKFAARFSKARISPIIKQSEKLKGLVQSASDSSEMKVIGSSVLHISGAATANQAISTPAQILIVDEYDFCNMQVLTMFSSRLRHNKDGGFRRKFSTPTVGGYGVNKEYSESDMRRYMVKCRHCEMSQAPDFKRQVVIPGYDGEFDKFTPEDIVSGEYLIDNSYIRCTKCGKELDSSMSNKDRREWVAHSPSRTKAGWAVKPYDLIAYNQTPKVIRQLSEYSRRQDFDNFVLGEVSSSAENQIIERLLRESFLMKLFENAEGVRIGIDVGKTCHIFIGFRSGGKYDVIRSLTVKADTITGETLLDKISEVIIRYSAAKVVIDAGPDFTLGRELIKKFGGRVSQCVYVKESTKKTTAYWKEDEEEQIIAAKRTRGLDIMVRKVNSGKFSFPESAEKEAIITQMLDSKRVEEIDDEGVKKAKWIKVTNNDHYFHACFYFMLACDIDSEEYALEQEVPVLPSIGGAVIGKKTQETHSTDVSAKNVARMFGVR